MGDTAAHRQVEDNGMVGETAAGRDVEKGTMGETAVGRGIDGDIVNEAAAGRDVKGDMVGETAAGRLDEKDSIDGSDFTSQAFNGDRPRTRLLSRAAPMLAASSKAKSRPWSRLFPPILLLASLVTV